MDLEILFKKNIEQGLTIFDFRTSIFANRRSLFIIQKREYRRFIILD